MARHKEVKNVMEDYVWELLPEVMKKYPHACKCDTCLADIAALALKSLTPKYVVRTNGEIISKTLDLPQFTVSVLMELTKAVEAVLKHPKHENNA
ncbi:late competence development ComFB family protein [Candidatus Formimonas warabiya]|uniref:Competence protein ComFB n=1 Tax=Formimonas warabiya TaxID=1761012 RepID=A0A3G1KVT4_FORW1|nr:late competence development ComFB family protein [Candidatus Formimonas warabiya]ATW26541.1 hypothetical protein DCMF_18895 [Candidatus Formimonas warabiya]